MRSECGAIRARAGDCGPRRGCLHLARERAAALGLLARRRQRPGPGDRRGAGRGHRPGGRAGTGRGRLGRRHPDVPAGLPGRDPADRRGRQRAARVAGPRPGPPARPRSGTKAGPSSEPASYAGMFLYGTVLETCWPGCSRRPGWSPPSGCSARLRAAKTPREVARIRTACRVAGRAFRAGSQQLRAGLLETEAAVHFRAPLSTAGTGFEGVERADGFAWCMSGPNAARARGRLRTLACPADAPRRAGPGPLQLLRRRLLGGRHAAPTASGEPDDRRRAMYEAVFAARAAALAAIRPGARAADVDRAAREVLEAARVRAPLHAPGRARRRVRRDRPQRPAPPPPEVGRTSSRPAWSSTSSRRSTSTATAACAIATWSP